MVAVTMRFSIGIALLVAQLFMIAFARVHPMRFYCWAPFDSQNEYRVDVTIGERQLSPREVNDRYHILTRGINPRTIYQVVSLIEYVESKYRPDEHARVQVTFRTNGSPEQVWLWPRQ